MPAIIPVGGCCCTTDSSYGGPTIQTCCCPEGVEVPTIWTPHVTGDAVAGITFGDPDGPFACIGWPATGGVCWRGSVDFTAPISCGGGNLTSILQCKPPVSDGDPCTWWMYYADDSLCSYMPTQASFVQCVPSVIIRFDLHISCPAGGGCPGYEGDAVVIFRYSGVPHP